MFSSLCLMMIGLYYLTAMRTNQGYDIRSFQRERDYARDMKILQFEEVIERQRSLTKSISKSPIPKGTHHSKRTLTQQSLSNMRAQTYKNPYMAGSHLRREPKPYKPLQKDEYYDSRASQQLQYLQSEEYGRYLQSFLNPPQREEDIIQKIRQTRNNNVYLQKPRHKENECYYRYQPRSNKAKLLHQRQKKDYSYLTQSIQNLSKITDDEYILINDPSANHLLSREAYLEENEQLQNTNLPRISRNPSGTLHQGHHDQDSRQQNTIQFPSKFYCRNRGDSREISYLAKENSRTIIKNGKNYAHLYERSSPLATSTKVNIQQTTPSKMKHTPYTKKIQWTPIVEIQKSSAKKENIQRRVKHSPIYQQTSAISNKNNKKKQLKEHILIKQAQISTIHQKTPQKCNKAYQQNPSQNQKLPMFHQQPGHKKSRQSTQADIYCIDFKLAQPGKPSSSFIRVSSTADLSQNASNHSRSHSKTKMFVVSISGKRIK